MLTWIVQNVDAHYMRSIASLRCTVATHGVSTVLRLANSSCSGYELSIQNLHLLVPG